VVMGLDVGRESERVIDVDRDRSIVASNIRARDPLDIEELDRYHIPSMKVSVIVSVCDGMYAVS